MIPAALEVRLERLGQMQLTERDAMCEGEDKVSQGKSSPMTHEGREEKLSNANIPIGRILGT
jgi:hypothetical protein